MKSTTDKILTVINDLERADILLKKSFELAEQFDAIIEVLYVHEVPLFDIPSYFQIDDEQLDVAKVKESLTSKIAPLKKERSVALFVKIADTPSQIQALVKEEPNTLVIVHYHDSLTEKIARTISQALLILKSDKQSYQQIALLLNANSQAQACSNHAQQHFLQANIHLLYDYRYIVDPSMELDLQNIAIIEQAQKEHFEAIKKSQGLEGEFFVDGSFFGEDLVSYIQKHAYDLLYICAHEDGFFTQDILIELLSEPTECDILLANRL